MSLLKNIAPKFEKTAAKTPLGDNDATWSRHEHGLHVRNLRGPECGSGSP